VTAEGADPPNQSVAHLEKEYFGMQGRYRPLLLDSLAQARLARLASR
jgi:hypothetical protein